MSKQITAAQAVELVRDGCTLTTTGFNGFGCPEDLIMSLAERYGVTAPALADVCPEAMTDAWCRLFTGIVRKRLDLSEGTAE